MLGRRTKSKWAHIAVIFSCLAVIIASMAPIAGAATTTAASTGSTVTNSENPYVLVAAKGGMGGQQSNNNNNNNNNNDSNKDKNVTSPQTGDSSNMFLWLVVLMTSAGGIVTIWATKRTHKKHLER